MKTRSTKWFTVAAMMAMATFSAYSFTAITVEQRGVILDHAIPGTTDRVLIAIPMDETDKIECHRAHGDRDYPYSDELYTSIIGSQEDGADYCRW